jgi:hypothetical protein
VGCFAHARRKFFEAAKVTEQVSAAEEGIQHIKKLWNCKLITCEKMIPMI